MLAQAEAGLMRSEWKGAARAGNIEELDRLLSEGSDIDALDEHGQTALMIAETPGHSAVARFLIGRGAKLNHTAKFRLTALMLAVLNVHVDIVRALVDAGADLAVRGTGAPGFHGKTALELAEVQERDGAVADGRLERDAELTWAVGVPRLRSRGRYQTVMPTATSRTIEVASATSRPTRRRARSGCASDA